MHRLTMKPDCGCTYDELGIRLHRCAGHQVGDFDPSWTVDGPSRAEAPFQRAVRLTPTPGVEVPRSRDWSVIVWRWAILGGLAAFWVCVGLVIAR